MCLVNLLTCRRICVRRRGPGYTGHRRVRMPSSRLNRPTFSGKQPKLGAICSIIYVKHASGRVRNGPMASPSDLDPRRPKVQAPETCQRPVPRRNPVSRWLGDLRVGVKLDAPGGDRGDRDRGGRRGRPSGVTSCVPAVPGHVLRGGGATARGRRRRAGPLDKETECGGRHAQL
jgi:hypothetical protein